MRISIFSDSFHPYISGVSIAILQQANALTSAGHEVSIVRPRPSRSGVREAVPGLDPSIRVFDTPLTIPHRAFAYLRLACPTFFATWRKLRKIDPEVIHVHTEFGTGWEGLAMARLRRVPLVGTFHTFFAEPEYLKHFPVPNCKITREMLWRYSVGFFNRCHTVLTPSKAVHDSLAGRGARCRLEKVSNGILPPQFLPAQQMALRRKEMGLEGFTFVYVGRVSHEKSIDLVIRAFDTVWKAHPEARLLIVGGGPQENELRELATNSDSGKAIQFTGPIPNHQLIRENYYRLGDVFVTASTTENQPVSILEALSFGLPLIGPRSKGLPELILDDLNGRLVEPKSAESLATAMSEILTNHELQESWAAGALRCAKEHDLTLITDRLVTLYEEAISDCGPKE
ncbi:MAG: glycosyltransferase [Verrucomicrobiota bacterium]